MCVHVCSVPSVVAPGRASSLLRRVLVEGDSVYVVAGMMGGG